MLLVSHVLLGAPTGFGVLEIGGLEFAGFFRPALPPSGNSFCWRGGGMSLVLLLFVALCLLFVGICGLRSEGGAPPPSA